MEQAIFYRCDIPAVSGARPVDFALLMPLGWIGWRRLAQGVLFDPIIPELV